MAIGILTGSGTYALPGFAGDGPAPVTTPWGEALVSRGEWAGVEVLHVSRHGAGHPRLSNHVTHRANIAALRSLGATAVLAVAVVAGIALTGGDDTHTVAAKVSLAAAPNARASLKVKGSAGTLNVRDFPPAGRDKVYEAWRMRDKKPVPAGLFRVDANGTATLALEEPLEAGDQVLVTVEPGGGAASPTSDPIMAAAVPA